MRVRKQLFDRLSSALVLPLPRAQAARTRSLHQVSLALTSIARRGWHPPPNALLVQPSRLPKPRSAGPLGRCGRCVADDWPRGIFVLAMRPSRNRGAACLAERVPQPARKAGAQRQSVTTTRQTRQFLSRRGLSERTRHAATKGSDGRDVPLVADSAPRRTGPYRRAPVGLPQRNDPFGIPTTRHSAAVRAPNDARTSAAARATASASIPVCQPPV